MFGYGSRRRRQRLRARRAAIREIVQRGELRPGPPAVALVRALYADHPHILVHPLETVFEADEDGLRVRAWIRIPAAQILPAVRTSMDLAAGAFADAPLAHRTFFLSLSYGLATRDIAAVLGTARRKVRRLLREAIGRLDASRQPARFDREQT